MTIPSYNDVHDVELTSDDALQERVSALLSTALRRQLWLLFLDGDDRQLPLMMPADIPRRPGDRETREFGHFLRGVMRDSGAARLVPVLERRGDDGVTNNDAEWFRQVKAACEAQSIDWRGPLLCHNRGVRWVAFEDFVS